MHRTAPPPDLVRLLTVWFEARLDEMMPPRRRLARRYGLEVIDAGGIAALDPAAVRVVFLHESTDVASLRAVCDDAGFDAIASVEWGWAAVADGPPRPTQFPQRRWTRDVTVTLADSEGAAA